MKTARLPTLGSDGFTIVELALATALAGIVSVVMLAISVNLFGSTLQAQATAKMALESQLILTQLVEDIRLSDGIAATNSLSDSNAPAGGWITNDPSNIIIIETPAIDSNRDIIYDSATASPYANETIYFATGNSMYKRILKNTAATGNIAVTTCPAASSNSTCPSDTKYTDHINNITFSFYDANNVSTANPVSARSVSLTVNMSRVVYGKTISLSNSTRTTLRNY